MVLLHQHVNGINLNKHITVGGDMSLAKGLSVTNNVTAGSKVIAE